MSGHAHPTSTSSDPIGEVLHYPLWQALMGRRSRRFFKGAEIPDGVFKYKSQHAAMPLSEEEKLLIITACGGNSAWHHMIYRGQRYAPHLSNYAGAASGRTFPSAAGFHTSQTFFTDDEGLYLLDARDAPPLNAALESEPRQVLGELKRRVRQLEPQRLRLPCREPYVEAHNTWVVNQPGTLLVIPVGDLAQHVLLNLMYMLQNGLVLYDDIHRRPIPGIAQFADLVDVQNVWPVTFVEQWSLSELTAEL